MVGGLSSRVVTAASESIQKNFSLYLSVLPGISTVLGRRSKQATWRAHTIAGARKTELPDLSSPERCPRNVNSLIYVFPGQGPPHKDSKFNPIPQLLTSLL